jgi:hypothetical protein
VVRYILRQLRVFDSEDGSDMFLRNSDPTVNTWVIISQKTAFFMFLPLFSVLTPAYKNEIYKRKSDGMCR